MGGLDAEQPAVNLMNRTVGSEPKARGPLRYGQGPSGREGWQGLRPGQGLPQDDPQSASGWSREQELASAPEPGRPLWMLLTRWAPEGQAGLGLTECSSPLSFPPRCHLPCFPPESPPL